MDYKIQLLSFLVSFLFGIFFCFTNYGNKKLIYNKKIIFQYIITFLYMINITLIYIVILYKVNIGIFHIYFLIMVFLGYLSGLYLLKKVNKIIEILKQKIKYIKK